MCSVGEGVQNPIQRHVVVIGGGVIGVSCCYELLRRGLRVTLLEQDAAGVARRGSFQNGNYLNSQWIPPIANSGFPREFLLSLLGQGQFLPLETSASEVLRPRFARWTMHLFAQFLPGRHDALAAAGSALAQDTIARIGELRARHKELQELPFRQGVLTLVANEKEALARAKEGKRIVPGPELVTSEPLLEPLVASGKVHCGAVNATGLSLDCHGFTERLHRICAVQPAMRTLFGARAERLVLDDKSERCIGVALQGGGEVACDDVVVAMGCQARQFLAPYAPRLPIIAVGGYSLDWRPSTPVLKTYSKVVLLKGLGIAQENGRLRMSGLVHFGGGMHHAPSGSEAARIAGLLRDRVLTRSGLDLAGVLPKPGDDSCNPSCWACFRPCTPDNLPMIGHLPPLKNLYVCCGHSFSGWGWSLASAGLLADAVMVNQGEGNLTSSVDPNPFIPTRFSCASWFDKLRSML